MIVKQVNIPDILPLLPVKDAVLFPNMVIPILVKTESFVPMLEDVMEKDKMVVVAMMGDEEKAALEAGNFSRVGTVASLVKMSKGSEGIVVVVQGLYRAVITGIVSKQPNYLVNIQKIHEQEKTGKRVEALKSNLINVFKELVTLSPYLPEEILNVVRHISDPGTLADIIASYLNIEGQKRQSILESLDVEERLGKLTVYVNDELEVNKMGQQIQNQVQKGIDKNQREYYLREQLKAIQKELGVSEQEPSETQELKEKLEKKKLPEAAHKVASKEIEKLSKMSPSSSEYTVVTNYLDLLLTLPWSESTVDKLDIKKAERILNQHHYDLQKVKKTNPRIPRGSKTESQSQGPHPLPGRPSGHRENQPRPVRCRGDRKEVCADLSGRSERRGGNQRPPAHLRRRFAREDHPWAKKSGFKQPHFHARRGGQARQ